MFVALVIPHAKRIRRIILSSVASSALPYFSTHLINGNNCTFLPTHDVFLKIQHKEHHSPFSQRHTTSLLSVFWVRLQFYISCFLLQKLKSVFWQHFTTGTGLKMKNNGSFTSLFLLQFKQTESYIKARARTNFLV